MTDGELLWPNQWFTAKSESFSWFSPFSYLSLFCIDPSFIWSCKITSLLLGDIWDLFFILFEMFMDFSGQLASFMTGWLIERTVTVVNGKPFINNPLNYFCPFSVCLFSINCFHLFFQILFSLAIISLYIYKYNISDSPHPFASKCWLV